MTDGERRDRDTRHWWIGFAAVLAVGAFGTWAAYADKLPPQLIEHHIDKLIHFSIGGGLAFFLDPALRRRDVSVGALRLPLSSLVILVPAGCDELAQRFSPARTSSVADFAADVAGVVALTWISRRLGRRRAGVVGPR